MSESEVSKEDLTDPTDTSEESLPDAEEEDEVAEGESVEPAEEEDVEGDAEVYKDRWVRLAAEFDNYKKRTLRERDALIQSANEGLIRDLLPIVDSVDRACTHADGNSESDAFKEGVRMIMEELPKILLSRGLEEIDASGQSFDPNLHEALMQVVSEHEAGTIAEVIERGYRLGDRVLRHAKVVVSQGPVQEDEKKSE
ncbi:nucleotide exchange factor GrpE [bacterium]|nr:nucleotide exchange factor GrpE [Gemmatimonadota bacterium]MCH2663975.1 nucleotide exchange factor GrpE [bacterium]HCK12144.1 nucleotide exchange factor GrpE [Candidatus Latescibacterota bacterium]